MIGCSGNAKTGMKCLVEDGDVHCMMIGAAGSGKTAFFLYPNIEYACASGMSFLSTDTKGDLYRNYAGIAKDMYGYDVAVIDLRNPTKSDSFNLLHLVNKYMDVWKKNSNDIVSKAKAEKYAKIISKTIIYSSSETTNYGQNQFFYDSAEGLLTSAILIVSEFGGKDERHIVSVFKLIQDLFTPTQNNSNAFKDLLKLLPDTHKAKWFAGSALNTSTQAMYSVLSTALARLNAFLDTELEQIICFSTSIDAEKFCDNKSAVFLVLPEEDTTKYFIVSIIIQQLYREILTVADETNGRLKKRVMFYLDEIGTIPKIDSIEMMFSASRSRRISIVAIIQSDAQLKKNYGQEGSEIIMDNCQLSITGGFAPNSQTAERISKSLGEKTILSGSISKGRGEASRSLQMISAPVMAANDLKELPKGVFLVSRTGMHSFRSKLKLFVEWGITFNKQEYCKEINAIRKVAYTDRTKIQNAILSSRKQPQVHSYTKLNQLENALLKELPIRQLFNEKRRKEVIHNAIQSSGL